MIKRLILLGAFVCLAASAHAQILLKQSTATTVNVKLTKIADGTDHTGLSVTSITAKFIKQSDTLASTVTAITCAAASSANDCVEVAAGVYNMELSASNTDTLGRFDVCALASGDYTDCTRYEVVNAGFYDLAVTTGPSTAPTNFSSMDISATGGVNIEQIIGTAISTPATAGILDVNIKNLDNDAVSASGTVTFPAATVASTTNITAGTITTATTATNVTTVNGLAAGVITPTAIAADAITAAKVATDVSSEIWSATTRQLSSTQAFSNTGTWTGNITGSVGTVGSGLYYLKTATATTGNRIHFIPFNTAGDPTKAASAVTCQISLDGSAAASVTDAPTEVEFTTGAYWQFDLTQAETTGKAAVIMCTGTGMVATPIMVEFQN